MASDLHRYREGDVAGSRDCCGQSAAGCSPGRSATVTSRSMLRNASRAVRGRATRPLSTANHGTLVTELWAVCVHRMCIQPWMENSNRFPHCPRARLERNRGDRKSALIPRSRIRGIPPAAVSPPRAGRSIPTGERRRRRPPRQVLGAARPSSACSANESFPHRRLTADNASSSGSIPRER